MSLFIAEYYTCRLCGGGVDFWSANPSPDLELHTLVCDSMRLRFTDINFIGDALLVDWMGPGSWRVEMKLIHFVQGWDRISIVRNGDNIPTPFNVNVLGGSDDNPQSKVGWFQTRTLGAIVAWLRWHYG